MAEMLQWWVAPLDELVHQLTALTSAPPPPLAVAVVAVDGHSASGKTTLAGRLAAAIPRAAVLHSDDLAWHHSVFGWRDLLVDGVLEPLRTGRAVAYRPPPWQERGREGAVEVPAGTRVLVLEGVGASRQDLTDLLTAAVWVETSEPERWWRDAERIAAGEVTLEVYESWMAEENPFLAADRPWDRADVIVAGGCVLPHDPVTQVVLGRRTRNPMVPGNRTERTETR